MKMGGRLFDGDLSEYDRRAEMTSTGGRPWLAWKQAGNTSLQAGAGCSPENSKLSVKKQAGKA